MLLVSQVHSFTGQMAEWVSTFLEAPVSLIDLINDTHALGAAHDPAAFMKRPRETDVRTWFGTNRAGWLNVLLI